MKLEDESDSQFIYRICSQRGIHNELPNWNSVKNLLNEVLGYEYETEKMYRIRYREYQELILKEASDINTNIKLNLKTEQDLYKERVRNQDVKREYRKTLRDEARIENLFDRQIEKIDELKESKPLIFKDIGEIFKPNNKKAILVLSDIHYGNVTDRFANKYNTEISKQRLIKLAQETVRYCSEHMVEELMIFNLGDTADGSIHVSSRVENELDAIDQLIEVSEVLSEVFTFILNNVQANVYYTSVTDNHMRFTPNYKDHIEKESFGKIVDEFLKLRLKDSRLNFNRDKQIDETLGVIHFGGFKIGYAHGHLDKKTKDGKNNFDNLVGELMDILILAHYHEFSYTKGVLVNGSVMGLNNYAINKRFSGKPSQTLLVLDKSNIIPIVIDLSIAVEEESSDF